MPTVTALGASTHAASLAAPPPSEGSTVDTAKVEKAYYYRRYRRYYGYRVYRPYYRYRPYYYRPYYRPYFRPFLF